MTLGGENQNIFLNVPKKLLDQFLFAKKRATQHNQAQAQDKGELLRNREVNTVKIIKKKTWIVSKHNLIKQATHPTTNTTTTPEY